ncbi:sushi, nidogen and EGF-like domain-containing protein 1 [Dysidea avara]|uniref:sushi, nidogen and EGF-like domain-containing protein 1 n=1 Tax=Dysidea avara TaxID=196820 RepID=UPI00331BED26
MQFYEFGFSQNDRTVPSDVINGDESSSIFMSEVFNFYGYNATTAYINDNGIISFGRSFDEEHTPLALPLQGSLRTTRIVAPYWADVDTRGTGNVFYRQTTNSSLLARATSEIRTAFQNNITITNLVIATWDAVGYFEINDDKTNSFQCVLATNGVESFVIFLYAHGRIEWTTGDASDGFLGLLGTEALAGINAGDGMTFITISGSRTPDIINIAETSNVGIPGVYIYRVDPASNKHKLNNNPKCFIDNLSALGLTSLF